MSYPVFVTLIVTVAAAFLLVKEVLRPDLVGMLVLVVLGFSGIVAPGEVFSGFSGSAVMTILGISIISEGLRQSGVTYYLGRWMQRLAGKSEGRLVVVVTLASSALSLFLNNIAAVGVLMPAVMQVSRQSKTAPGKLLIPLAYGTLLGGMATLLTTSNIIVSGALKDAGYQPYGLLDFMPVGIPLVVLGTAYLWMFRGVLPANGTGQGNGFHVRSELLDLYRLNQHLSVVRVLDGSPLDDLTLSEAQWCQRTGLTVLGLTRGKQTFFAPGPAQVVKVDDVLLVQGDLDQDLLDEYRLCRANNLTSLQPELSNPSVALAEIVIAPSASMVGRTLREVQFRTRYHLNILGIWRRDEVIQTGLNDVALQAGDILLSQGSAGSIKLLSAEPDLVVVNEDPDAILRPGKHLLALGITLVTLFIASLGNLPIAQVVMAGAMLLVLTGCLSMQDIYRAVEWKAIFLIAGMWPLSIAIRDSGLAESAVVGVLGLLGGNISIIGMAAFLLCLSFLMTQIMSGQVASLALAPLAISAAALLGADARGLGMAVALGCSLAFPTPFGHPVNVMVMSAGGYNLKDYVKIGLPLTILAAVIILSGLKLFWGM